MSFVSLEKIDFSREDRLEETPIRLRSAARCRSPVPESDTSRTEMREASRRSSRGPGSLVQPTPAHQASIPRHRRIGGAELLHTIDESVDDLRRELHNQSAGSRRSGSAEQHRERIDDICRKLDVIATVVLRHERELKERSLLDDAAAAPASRSKPAYPQYYASSSAASHESAVLMRSILEKVNEVNNMMSYMAASRPPTRGATTASCAESFNDDLQRSHHRTAANESGPLFRIAEALDTVTREVQRQHATIDRLVAKQEVRDEEERIATIMRECPPSDVASSAAAEDSADLASVEGRFQQRLAAAGAEHDEYVSQPRRRTPTPGGETASFAEEDATTGVIEANEESPRRARYAAEEQTSRLSSGRISVNECSPQRVRVAAAAPASASSSRIASNEASPRRARAPQDRISPAEYYEPSVEDLTPQAWAEEEPSPRRARAAATVAARRTAPAVVEQEFTSPVRTVTKQPEYLLRSHAKSTVRKPVVRGELFDSSSDSDDALVAKRAHQSGLQQRSSVGSDRSQATAMSPGAQDALIRRLLAENESLKEQLHHQLLKADELRELALDVSASPVGRSRLGRSMLA